MLSIVSTVHSVYMLLKANRKQICWHTVFSRLDWTGLDLKNAD